MPGKIRSIVAGLCVFCGVVHAQTAPCSALSTKYFSWAALKTYPPKPTDPQSESWATEQETKGGSYYVAEYCQDGRILSLTKRLGKATFFRYDYSYNGSKLVEVRLTDADGKAKVIAPK